MQGVDEGRQDSDSEAAIDDYGLGEGHQLQAADNCDLNAKAAVGWMGGTGHLASSPTAQLDRLVKCYGS